jgi:hypothetical protein
MFSRSILHSIVKESFCICSAASGRPGSARLIPLVLLVLAAAASILSAPAAIVVTSQPANAIAGTNEDISFSVAANGPAPLAYQWLYNGSVLSGATNTDLVLTNLPLGYAGNYSVLITGGGGALTNSSTAVLYVQTNAVRRLVTGTALQSGSTISVPIIFRSNGREGSVSFSLLYGTNFINPRFTTTTSNATTSVDTTLPGAIGVAITLTNNSTFAAGYQELGLAQFDLSGEAAPFAGNLLFGSSPTPIAAATATAQPLNISANVLPQYTLVTPTPVLRLQSGLFEHQLLVSNPSSSVMTNLNILALNLGFDSQTNAIQFWNAQGTLTTFPYNDPLISTGCGAQNCALDFSGTIPSLRSAQINNLAPGETRLVTIELFSPDFFTVPQPQYSVALGDAFPVVVPPSNGAIFAIDSARYLSNTFIVEFPTLLGNHYWLQYSDTAEGVVTGRVALPSILGTGSRMQWLDNGPPKTISQPTNGARFYRVLSDQK